MGSTPMGSMQFEDLKPKSREFGAGGLQPTLAPQEDQDGDQFMKFLQQMQMQNNMFNNEDRQQREIQSVLKRNPLDGLMDDVKPMHPDGPLMPPGKVETDEQGRRIAPAAPKRMGPERGPY